VSPTILSAYIYIQPVLATAIAIANNEEKLSVTTVLYGLLIMIGVFLISLPKKEASLN
jgi:drug/metabolite transporter (DMT)-like permease